MDRKSRPRIKTTIYSLLLPDGRLLILFSKDEQLILPKLSPLQKELLMTADGYLTVEEIIELLSRKGFVLSIEELLDQLKYFNEKFLLEDLSKTFHEAEFPEFYKEKFSRQLAFFGVYGKKGLEDALEFQKKLKNSHVVLIGAGGFGSDIFYCLTAMGIGKITVVDYDFVELSNLNRQSMYSEEDIGKAKIDILREKSKTISTSKFNFINQKIQSTGDIIEIIKDVDIGIIVADSPREKIFHWMNKACYETKVPGLFTSGATPLSVIIGPLVVPGATTCYSCSMLDIPFCYNDPLIQLINSRLKLGVISPYIRVASGLMSLELMKHLTGFAPCRLYNQTIQINLLDYNVNFLKKKSKEGCSYCWEIQPGKKF